MSETIMNPANVNPDVPERRQHFRGRGQAVVEYRPFLEGEGENEHEGPSGLAALFPPSLGFALRADLLALDEELEPALRRIADQDRATANGLRLLGRKLDRLVQAFCEQTPGPAPVAVTLSEGGLSFVGDTRLAPGERLALRVALQPGGEGILSTAEVVYSLALGDGQWRTGLRFIDLDLGARDLIVRHLLAHQGRQRRAARPELP